MLTAEGTAALGLLQIPALWDSSREKDAPRCFSPIDGIGRCQDMQPGAPAGTGMKATMSPLFSLSLIKLDDQVLWGAGAGGASPPELLAPSLIKTDMKMGYFQLALLLLAALIPSSWSFPSPLLPWQGALTIHHSSSRLSAGSAGRWRGPAATGPSLSMATKSGGKIPVIFCPAQFGTPEDVHRPPPNGIQPHPVWDGGIPKEAL